MPISGRACDAISARSVIISPGFDGDFLIVQSTGGLFGVEEAQSACIRMLESGPAAGIIGTKALCDRIGLKNAIAFDMGGTTAKAGVIHGGDVLMTGGALIGGYATGLPVQIPMIDIQEVGTGGGSIARAEMGALHVGPESAGAQPGPVCYGLGGAEPTITDANLILGRLGADRFLGGEIKLDVEGARRALEARVAKPLGLDLTAAADGILRIATTKMSHMVRWVTTERGLDAADFTLVAMAALALCTPRWSRGSCASPRSSSRAPPAIFPPTACWSRSCAAIS
jgi:N-methylhydantoinase A